MKVVAFNGSARKGGNTAILLGHVLGELRREGIETELVELSGSNIHGCLACRTCSKHRDGHCAQVKDIGNACIDKMVAADGILLGSPTYFSDLSPEIKALIDRAGLVAMANGGMFRRKVGAAVVAVRRAGAIHYVRLNQSLFPDQRNDYSGFDLLEYRLRLRSRRRLTRRGSPPHHDSAGTQYGLAPEEAEWPSNPAQR